MTLGATPHSSDVPATLRSEESQARAFWADATKGSS